MTGLAILVALALVRAPPTPLEAARAAFPGWTVSDTGVGFVVATPGPRGHARAVAIVAEVVRACEHDFTRTRPAAPWTAFVLPDRQAYRRFVQAHFGPERWADAARGAYGFADAERRWLVLDHGPGPGTLAHEVVHPLLDADFPSAPVWLDEGFAALFEHKRWVDGRLDARVNWRMRTLRARRDDVALERLLASDPLAFWAHGDLNMAAARHLLVWLEERGWLASFYRSFRDDPARDPTGRAQLEAVTGLPLAALEAQWRLWIARQRAP